MPISTPPAAPPQPALQPLPLRLLPGFEFGRALDPATGYRELVITPRS